MSMAVQWHLSCRNVANRNTVLHLSESPESMTVKWVMVSWFTCALELIETAYTARCGFATDTLRECGQTE